MKRLRCLLGAHKWKGTKVPHVYACEREGCPAMFGGYP